MGKEIPIKGELRVNIRNRAYKRRLALVQAYVDIAKDSVPTRRRLFERITKQGYDGTAKLVTKDLKWIRSRGLDLSRVQESDKKRILQVDEKKTEIVKLLEAGKKPPHIALATGVSAATVRRIRDGKR